MIAWVAIYLASTALLGVWLTHVRSSYLSSPNNAALQASWDAWKADVRQGDVGRLGPVARRVPTANEPPATILLRDHFGSIVLTVFLVWSAAFGFLAMAITGVLRGTPTPRTEQGRVGS